MRYCTVDNCKNKHYAKGLCHTHYNKKYVTPEYCAWNRMKDRCYNKNYQFYKYYGGRGITVCDRWRNSFSNFFADMGNKPSTRHSLDKVDNNGNYEPSNCRWATPLEQASNKSNNNRTVGVSFYRNKWQAKLEINRVCVYRHMFDTYEKAVIARKDAEKKYCVI